MRVVTVGGNGARGSAAGTKVLRALAFDYDWTGTGALSLKCAFRGEVNYGVGPARYSVNADQCLLLNRGQEYHVDVREPSGVEMFAVFFAPGFFEECAGSLKSPVERLLDQPRPEARDIEVFQRLLPMTNELAGCVGRLSRLSAARDAEPGLLDEALRNLTAKLLQAEDAALLQTHRLSALKTGTRAELFRRLLRGRDYAASCFREPIGLDDIARVACLSPSHLLRSFREAFGVTPHQFLTARRLEAAYSLLKSTSLPVTEICLSLGFQSLGSFSTLFRNRLGEAPSAVRKKSFSRSGGSPGFGEMATYEVHRED